MRHTNKLLLFFGMVFITFTSQAFLFGPQSPECSPVYECNCNPLYCGAFDVALHAGVAPLVWIRHSPLRVGTSVAPAPRPVLTLFNGPRFNNLFHMPLLVGAQVGYAWSDALRLYAEGNYLQANGKKEIQITTLTTPPLVAKLSLHPFRLFDAYIGAQYYWPRWCDRVSFFVGGKVGFTHHWQTRIDITVAVPVFLATNFLTDQLIFKHRTTLSGGFNAGLDICFCGNWAFVITAEVVASGHPSINKELFLDPIIAGQFTSVSFGSIATELRFPITAGVRYMF